MDHLGGSPIAPGAAHNLALVLGPLIERQEFELLARHVREMAPEIQTAVLDDRPMEPSEMPLSLDLPTLTFSPAPLRHLRPFRGAVFQGKALSKSQEYAALEGAEIPVPRWEVVTPDRVPDLTEFGPYVVFKPDLSGNGADVRIMRKGRVRWRPPSTDFTNRLADYNRNWVVQEFVYTGPWPVSYRVTTLFGEPIFSLRVEADRRRRELPSLRLPWHRSRGRSLHRLVGCRLCVQPLRRDEDPGVGRSSTSGVSHHPASRLDILEDAETGQLYVVEVNAVGLTWHFSSRLGRAVQQQFGIEVKAELLLDAQADGRSQVPRESGRVDLDDEESTALDVSQYVHASRGMFGNAP